MHNTPKLEDVFKPKVLKELNAVLAEIESSIQCVWDDDYHVWIASHPDYQTVEASDETKELAIYRFKGYLGVFIEHRLRGKIDPLIEAQISGWGGYRSGAGRPKKEPKKQVYLPVALAEWIKIESNLAKVKQIAFP
jgi:hypothetical protein